MAYVIGVDVGGTFTDAVLADDAGTIVAAKAPSTPPDYSEGVLDVLTVLAGQVGLPVGDMLADTHHVAHGTTSSLNALVTGNVPPVGFITTRGHRDSIYIMNVEGRYLGRSPEELQNVLIQGKSHGLIPKRHAWEVTERLDRDGGVVVDLNEDEARAAIRSLIEDGVAAIAVSLLWSFRNPAHERRIRDLVHEADPDLFVSLSSEVSPRIREFARSATTIMSTQVGPGLRDYLSSLEGKLAALGLAGPLLVMQSNGGAVAAAEAPANAISTVGSVLTGGVIGSVSLGQQLGHKNIISTDVGGTTFLVGLVVDGEPVRASTTIINHHPINVPSLQVHAIGSGGGAIAWIDAGGNLQVGPGSAQAVPGPACYGQGGEEPTNTDANLVLGILTERGLLGGRKALDVERSRTAIRTRIAQPLGLSVDDAAAAIYAIQNAQTGDLLRKAVVEAGHDPRDFVLYAFGGARPTAPRTRLRWASGRSSSRSDRWRPRSPPTGWPRRTSSWPPSCPIRRRSPWTPRVWRRTSPTSRRRSGRRSTVRESHSARSNWPAKFDMRYSMQLAELATPVSDGPIDAAEVNAAAARFEQRYADLFGAGSGFREAGIQAITYRVRATGVLRFSPGLPSVQEAGGPDPSPARISTRPVRLGTGGFTDTAIYDYSKLRAGHVITGPAVVEVPSTTVVVPDGMSGTVDPLGNLIIITREEPAR